MLYRHSEVFRSLLVVADLAVVALAWLGAYYLRFHAGIDAPKGIPPFEIYLRPVLVIVPLWYWLFQARGLYDPMRAGSLLVEAGKVLRATATGVVLLVAMSFFIRSESYSRGVVLAFSALSAVGVIGLRTAARFTLRRLRRRGYNLRFAVVVGGPDLAREVIARIHGHPEAGIRVTRVLCDSAAGRLDEIDGVPIGGGYAALKPLLRSERVDQVIVALPRDESMQLDKVLRDLDDEMVSVRIVPDLIHAMSIGSSVEELAGMPVISLRESPMVGWASVQKRAFDLAVASVAMVFALPLMIAIAGAIAVTSGRPIFYRQHRMGLDGRVFEIWKFRTLVPDAEADTGPIWAQIDDERRTRLGAWLRWSSFDELPQLWNVIRGDMSLVGPRPERLAFIEEFRREVPGYMLRHKVKAGCTGWAQIHGWRGNTSLHERIEHDIYYIQNWSIGLDVRILLQTLASGFFHDNAR